MNIEQAIEWLKAISATQNESIHKNSLSERKEALYMAIKELEKQKELKENCDIKGKWEMTYKGMIKDANTGLMIAAYNCKCSVCGWETGNQGTRFNYCPNCGQHIDTRELN